MNQKGFMFKKNSEYRPGSLGGSVKLVLSAFMALAFVVAFSASAMAEAQVSVSMSAAFGNYSSETKTTDATGSFTTEAENRLRTDGQAAVNLQGGNDSVSGRYYIRHQEDSKAAHTTRFAITWKASDAVNVIFNGRSFGRAGQISGYAISGGVGTMGDGTPIGDNNTTFATFANTTGIDINFNAGNIGAGLKILDSCAPGCGINYKMFSAKAHGLTINAGATDDSVTKNAKTFVPYFYGNFGAIQVGANLTSASAFKPGVSTDGKNDKDKELAGSQMEVVAIFTAGDMKVGGAFGTATIDANKDPAAGGSATDGDLEKSLITLGVKVAGLHVKYGSVTSEIKDSGASTAAHEHTDTEISAAYALNAGGTTLYPQFAQRTAEYTNKTPGSKDTFEISSTYVGLGIKSSF